ncbi:MAG: hypothetical protein MRY32_00725 [Rickettsiales bacterium]|nr:hypothetical protein [Rickettsiales bacterium]
MLSRSLYQRVRYRRISLLAFAAICALGGAIYSLFTPPLYEFTATIRIHSTNELEPITDRSAEAAILTSSSLIAETLDAMGHDIEIYSGEAPYLEKLADPAASMPYPQLRITYAELEPFHYDQIYSLKATARGSFDLESGAQPAFDITAEGNHIRLEQAFTLIPRYRNERVRHIKQHLRVTYDGDHVIHLHYADRNPSFAGDFLNAHLDLYIAQARERQAAELKQAVSYLKRNISADERQIVSQQLAWDELQKARDEQWVHAPLEHLREAVVTLRERRDALAKSLLDALPPHETLETASLPELDELDAQIKKLEVEVRMVEKRQRDHFLLEQEMTHTRQSYLNKRAQLEGYELELSQVLGFAQLVDLPDAQAKAAYCNPFMVALYAGLGGYGIALFYAIMIPLSGKPTNSQPKRRAAMPSYNPYGSDDEEDDLPPQPDLTKQEETPPKPSGDSSRVFI